MVDKRTTELSLIFVLVGMVFLVPAITGEALGNTEAAVKSTITWQGHVIGDALTASLVEKRLDEGKWVKEPNCIGVYGRGVWECSWVTKGTGFFGGAEAGHVIYKYQDGLTSIATVKFWWYNPESGANTCGAVVLEQPRGHVTAGCHITQGNSATATYWVNYDSL